MNGNFLLDTNIVIALFDKDDAIINKIKVSDKIFIPSIVIGELYYGAFNSSKKIENIEKINQFKLDANVLNCDSITAFYYGKVKKELKVIGNPIPENDIWIASLAIQYNLQLVSRDKHFYKIENLITIQW